MGVGLETGPSSPSGHSDFPHPLTSDLMLLRSSTNTTACYTALSTSHLRPYSSLPCPGGPHALGATRLGSGPLVGSGPLWEERDPRARAGGAWPGGGVLNLEAEQGAHGRGGEEPNLEHRKLSLRSGLLGRAGEGGGRAGGGAEGRVRAEGAGPGSRAGRGAGEPRGTSSAPQLRYLAFRYAQGTLTLFY